MFWAQVLATAIKVPEIAMWFFWVLATPRFAFQKNRILFGLFLDLHYKLHGLYQVNPTLPYTQLQQMKSWVCNCAINTHNPAVSIKKKKIRLRC